MSSQEDLEATRTRPFATTVAAGAADDARPESDADDSNLPGPGSIVGIHYRLMRLLGEGNFGKVYVAERIDVPEHRVALKVLPKSFYVGRDVERELVMLAKIGHPHVVQLMDHGMNADFVWLTMPVYQGETLGERLQRGPLELREAHDILLPIARAIEALHAAGLRHQDVKPENIFLAQFAGRMHPVVLDLGVAAEKDGGFVAGTALYAAPEQLAAILGNDTEVPLSEKMDVYCFGAMVLRALVGEKKFPGAKALTRRQVIDSHHKRATEPLDDDAIPELTGEPRAKLKRYLARWMAIPPEERPTMNEVAEELDVLLEPERERERAEEHARTAQKRALARARVAAAIVLVAAAGLGGVALWKRETLRLAGELEEARARGAESFDKLDTCVASHAVAKREAQVCGTDLTRERNEHEKTLTSLANAKQGQGCDDIIEQLRESRATVNHERKKHEDELKAEEQSCVAEKDKLTSDYTAEKKKIEEERTALESSVKQLTTEVEDLRSERDTCMAGKPPPNPTGGGTAPAGSGTPVAPGTGTPEDPYEPAPPAPKPPAPPPTTMPTSLSEQPTSPPATPREAPTSLENSERTPAP
jgi:serine/threonine protein kinase